jgi:cation diffusion facilitator family transporter
MMHLSPLWDDLTNNFFMSSGEIPHPKSGERIAAVGIGVNIGLTVIKFLGGIFGNSYALIADAIESGTDIVGSAIVYLWVRYAQKPADTNHPYGHGKTEPMAWLAVSILLVFAMIEIARGAIARIQHPEIGIPESWTLIILIGVVWLKGALFLRGYVIGKSLKSTAVTGDAFHHLSDAVTTGIALIGTFLALYAGPHWSSAADWAALIASGFMAINIFHIGWPAIRELLDESVDPDMESSIRTLISDIFPQVLYLPVIYVRKSGFDRLVELHIVIDGEKTVREGHVVAHQVEEGIKKHFPNIQSVVVHVEPSYTVIP